MYGFNLIITEPNTEIEHEGKTLVITDEEAVVKGMDMFVTQRQYDAIVSYTKEDT